MYAFDFSQFSWDFIKISDGKSHTMSPTLGRGWKKLCVSQVLLNENSHYMIIPCSICKLQHTVVQAYPIIYSNISPLKGSIWAVAWENRIFAYGKTKTQISFAVTVKLINAFVFPFYTDSSITLPKYKISSLYPSSVASQPGLCLTWSETPKTGFLRMRLIWACTLLCAVPVSLPLWVYNHS